MWSHPPGHVGDVKQTTNTPPAFAPMNTPHHHVSHVTHARASDTSRACVESKNLKNAKMVCLSALSAAAACCLLLAAAAAAAAAAAPTYHTAHRDRILFLAAFKCSQLPQSAVTPLTQRDLQSHRSHSVTHPTLFKPTPHPPPTLHALTSLHTQ